VVGRISPIKGQHLVIEAAPEILAENPGVRFVFVGDEDPSFPGCKLKLERLIEEEDLRSKFTFAGYEADVLSAYCALDIVVFPTSSEGFGRVVIEAGAARKALVVTELDVLRELLSPGMEDLIVPRHAKALARRIVYLANDEAFRQETADRLHRYVTEKFALKGHRDALMKLYAELIGKAP
jgi:glycosyltransferase involved in cell wall biosynthesis